MRSGDDEQQGALKILCAEGWKNGRLEVVDESEIFNNTCSLQKFKETFQKCSGC